MTDWTINTLYEHFTAVLDEREKAVEKALTAQEKSANAALNAAEKAVIKAENASEKRFEGVNEFRAQLSDQAATFLSRNEYSAAHIALISKVESGNKVLGDRIEGMSGAIDIKINTLNAVFLDKIDNNQKQMAEKLENIKSNTDNRIAAIVSSIGQIASRMDVNEGKNTGLQDGWKYLIGFMGLVMTVVSLYLLLKKNGV